MFGGRSPPYISKVHRVISNLGHGTSTFGKTFFTDHTRHEHARFDGNRFVNDALLLGVIAHLDMADEREILAERMPDETVIGEDAAQVRMPFEHDAEEIERLALIPVGRIPDAGHGGDHRTLVVQISAQTQAPVVPERQQMINRGEARSFPRPRGRLAAVIEIIHAAYVHELLEGKRRVVAQRAAYLDDPVTANVQRELPGELMDSRYRLAEHFLGVSGKVLMRISHDDSPGGISGLWCWYGESCSVAG